MRHYHPAGQYVWDVWMTTQGREVHAFHLTAPRPGHPGDPETMPLAHAVSTDLLEWREEASALAPGPPGADDDMQHWTGDIVEKDGVYHLFYTGRSRREAGLVQRTMLATSTDLATWTRHPSNPVMVADARWYQADQVPERSMTVSWRDPKIVLDAPTGWYIAFLAADLNTGEHAERGCIARARSRDLIEWEVVPPAFAPHRYACVEVPDVFEIDGTWYMTFLTGTPYGNPRRATADPYIGHGTLYAVSDSLDGPFVEPPDNVLIGGATMQGTACRSILRDGRRSVFYWQAEREGASDAGRPTVGVLTHPKSLHSPAANVLQARYDPIVQSWLGRELDADPVSAATGVGPRVGSWSVDGKAVVGASRLGWAILPFGEEASGFMLTTSITIESGRAAGLLFHAEPEVAHPGPDPAQAATAIILDVEESTVTLCQLRDFRPIETRSVALRVGRPYHVRIFVDGPFVEAYLDDVLVINAVRYALPAGRFALFVERAEARFADVSIAGIASPPTS
jgi:beta-fructofuranosidase